jgi:hypothetical protein
MNIKWIAWLLFPCLLSPRLQGQTIPKTVQLPLHSPKLHLGSIPFKEILVLDNRLAPPNIFIDESGGYPVWAYAFDRSGADVIKEYLDRVIAPLSKGEKTLLLNIQQLRIPNKRNIIRKVSNRRRVLRKGGKEFHAPGLFPLRESLLFSAEAYYRTNGDGYHKIVTVHEYYYTYEIHKNLGQLIARALNDLLETVSTSGDSSARSIKRREVNYLWADSLTADYSADTLDHSWEQINGDARDRWTLYPIWTSQQETSGVYQDFDDFKYDNLRPGQVQVKWNEKDSLYNITLPQTGVDAKRNFHWAVRDKGSLYLWVSGNAYLKLAKEGNRFCFDLPATLPDMYTLLSMEESKSHDNVPSPHTGNLLADLGALLIGEAAGDAIKHADQKRMAHSGAASTTFRHCFIDMDSGDLIY